MQKWPASGQFLLCRGQLQFILSLEGPCPRLTRAISLCRGRLQPRPLRGIQKIQEDAEYLTRRHHSRFNFSFA